jgi:beta-mannosidase
MDTHNKSGGAEQKMPKYLGANFRLDYTNLQQTIYCSQLMQCEALSYANRAWRRGWKGEREEESAGILIWQLNDIYPCTSWALVDSFFRKKPAFWTSKRDFAKVIVGISRTPVWHFVDENKRSEHPTDVPKFEVYASNLGMEPLDVELRLRMYDWSIHKEIELDEGLRKQSFKLNANEASEMLQVDSPEEVQESSLIILAATLHDAKTGNELNRHFSWPEPYRYLYSASESSVDVKVDGDVAALTCGKFPVKALLAYVDEKDGEDADWEDNMYDLMPGETVKLPVKSLDGRKVSTKWLYSWEK